jgi:hypothetical protein
VTIWRLLQLVAAVNSRNGLGIFPARIFRLTRVTRIFQKSVFTEITR